MADFAKVAERVARRTRPDGVVEDRQVSPDVLAGDAGRVVSLSPAVVRLRDGSLLEVDAVVESGVLPTVGDDVALLRLGGFVLVLGKVRML